MSLVFKPKQLGNKYIIVAPGNQRLPGYYRTKRQAMNQIALELSKLASGQVSKDLPELGTNSCVSLEEGLSSSSNDLVINSSINPALTQELLEDDKVLLGNPKVSKNTKVSYKKVPSSKS